MTHRPAHSSAPPPPDRLRPRARLHGHVRVLRHAPTRRRRHRHHPTAPSTSASPSSTPPTCTARSPTSSLVGRAIAGRRDEVVLATKFGNVALPTATGAASTATPEYVRAACDASPASGSASTTSTSTTSTGSTPNVPIEETVGAMAELVAAGKVRHLGLSEASADTHPPRARGPPDHRAADRVLAVEPRPRGRGPPDAARAGHRPGRRTPRSAAASSPARSRAESASRGERLRRSAYFPRFNGEGFDRQPASSSTRVRAIAEEKGCTPGQLALAWVLAQGDDVVPDPRAPSG